MRPPARRADIDPFVVMEVMAHAALLDTMSGDVIHLEVGQPSTGAPRAALEAARRVLESGDPLGYTAALGLPELRSAIAARYSHRHGVEVPPERVAVTAGASGACVLAFLAAFEPSEAVGVAVPGYPCYRQMLRAFGTRVVDLPARVDAGFTVTIETLEAANRGPDGPLAGVVLASPANPTGTVTGPVALDEVAAWCAANDTWLVSDEIYEGITFGAPTATAARYGGTITIGSFSKYFCMTGWRLGWMVVPEVLLSAVDRLQQNLFLCASTIAQHAALGALGEAARPELEAHVARYRTNRDTLVAALEALGLDTVAPADGAFYVYADTSSWHDDSRVLCERWLDEIHLAATPGIDFDTEEGHRWVRFSVSGSHDTIDRAIRRLREWREGSGREPRP